MAFSPDGTTLITGGALRDLPGQLKFWNIPAGEERFKIRGVAGVRTVAYYPDGKSFLTGDFAGDIKLRDAETGAEKTSVKAHANGVNGIVFAPDGQSFASAGLDQTVKLWDAKSLKLRQTFRGHAGLVYGVAFFRHGQAIVSASEDSTAKIWAIDTGQRRPRCGATSKASRPSLAPDDQTVATAGWDGASSCGMPRRARRPAN